MIYDDNLPRINRIPNRTKIEKTKYLVGIIPICSSIKSDYGAIIPDVLMPLAPNYTMLENAVFSCICAGCKSIFIVLEPKTFPIIKKILGEQVNNLRGKRPIPIFYILINSYNKETRKNNCFWAILTGAAAAYKISLNLSRWIIPNSFYVSFPYGIINHEDIKKNKKLINANKKRRFYFSCENITIKDGEYLPFTFDYYDFVTYLKLFKSLEYSLEDGEKDINFELKTIFSKKYSNKNSSKVEGIGEIDWFCDVSTWEGYKNFISSDYSKNFQRPSNKIFPKEETKIFNLLEEEDKE